MNKTIQLTALVSDESSVVEATAPAYGESGEGSVQAKGWAKKHPKDKPSEAIGYNVAVARALRALADEYDKRAETLMENPVKEYFISGTLSGHNLGYAYRDEDSIFNFGRTPNNYSMTLNSMTRSDVV